MVSRIDSYVGTCLPSLALDLDVPPGLARFEHDRSLTDEHVRSDKRSLSLRPPSTDQDADDRPDHRCSEADTVPRMRQQKEKGKPNEEREHEVLVPETLLYWRPRRRRGRDGCAARARSWPRVAGAEAE